MSLPSVDPSRRKATVVSVALLVVCATVAYSNSFAGRFVFDDIPSIVENPSIRKLSPLSVVLFQGGVSTVGRPLVNFSLALNYVCGEFSVTGYHLVNLFVHVLAGLVLFGAVRRTLEESPAAVSLKAHATPTAFFCALIWLLHPLQTESVTYIVQRSESLVGLFYFLTLYCSMRARSSPRAIHWYVAALLACLGGVASKEVIVSAPVAVVIYDWAFSGQSLRQLFRERCWFYAALCCTWIPLAGLVAQGREESAGFGFETSSWDYAMTQFGAITRYLRLSLWPDSLVLDYGAAVTRKADEILPAALVVGLLGCASVVAIRYQPWLAFLGFFFFATLSPSSSFIPLVTQTVAEHRMYLPLASVVIIVVVAVWRVCGALTGNRLDDREPSERSWIVPGILLSAVAVALGVRTFARNAEYGSPVRLWAANVRRYPDSLRPYLQIAREFEEQDPQKAIDWLNRAIDAFHRIEERNGLTIVVERHLAGIYSRRGTAHSMRREFEQALVEFDRALEVDADFVDAHFYRGMVLAQLGREDEALASVTKAIELKTIPGELFIRGEILARMKRYTEAISDLSKAIEQDEMNPSFYQSRGQCFVEVGRYQEAVLDLTRAIQLRPNSVKALYNRGRAAAAMDRHASAIEDYSRALRLSPDFADAYRERARSLIDVGQKARARNDLQQFEKLSGNSDSELRGRLVE